jgi:hypothetical protein
LAKFERMKNHVPAAPLAMAASSYEPVPASM